MATAAELLASMRSSDDATLLIDNHLRTITIPPSIKNLGVESDDDVLRLNFRMPRYLDETDLSSFSIRINYMNANGDGDVYTVSDKVIGTESITFSWLVGPTATAYKGNTKFNVCMKIVDNSGYVQKEYNTTIVTLPVLEGLEVDERVVTQYSDILEQWKRELFGIGNTEEASMRAVSREEQENIAQKGAEVLATIPEEYQETAKAAQEGVRTKADAIVCSAEGNIITISDSSDDHVRGLKIFGKTTQTTTTGKNLLPNNIKSYGSRNGITFSDLGDDRIKVSGVATSNTTYVYCPFDVGTRTPIPAGTYTVSGNPGKNVYLSFFLYESQETTEILQSNASLCEGKSWTFTIDQDAYYGAYLFVGNGKSVADTIISAQLEIGTVATEYEPYSGGFASPSPEWAQELTNLCEDGTLGVSVYGKNLLDFVGVLGDGYTNTLNGLTVTVKDGFAITTGTNTSNSFTNIIHAKTIPADKKPILPAGTYTTHPRLRVSVIGKITNAWGNMCGTFNFAEPFTITGFYIAYGGNETVNESIPLMLTSGSDVQTTYEKCRAYQTVAISTANSLPAIPLASGGDYVDSFGQQWICDEIDFDRGVYVQRIGTKVFDGSADENWLATDTAPVKYYISIPGKRSNYEFKPNALRCTHFKVDPSMNTYARGYITETYYHSGNINVLLNYDNGAGGVDGFKTFLRSNPITVQYVLETPVETSLTAEEIETFKATHTNVPNTTVFNDSGAWMELSYNADTKTHVENSIQRAVSEVAVDAGSLYVTMVKKEDNIWTTSHNYTEIKSAYDSGRVVMCALNGKLVMPLTSINSSVAIFQGPTVDGLDRRVMFSSSWGNEAQVVDIHDFEYDLTGYAKTEDLKPPLYVADTGITTDTFPIIRTAYDDGRAVYCVNTTSSGNSTIMPLIAITRSAAVFQVENKGSYTRIVIKSDGTKTSTVENFALEGAAGQNGVTFTPSVSEDGILSWTNDGGLDNPEPVDLGISAASGVHIGPDEPSDPNINLWIDTDDVDTEDSGSETPTDAYIPIPETAEVGQTVVVKAVDENGKPTEWEAVDFPSGSGGSVGSIWLQPFELMGTATLQDDCTRWIITQTDDGTPIDSKQYRAVKILTNTTASGDTTATNANSKIWLNHPSGGVALTGTNMVHTGGYRKATFYGEIANGYYYLTQLGYADEKIVRRSDTVVMKIIMEVDNSTHKFGAGSTVEIWGCQ